MSESELLELVKRIQQQLGFLEKKIDTLLSQQSQSPAKPFEHQRFPKPFRPFRGPRPEFRRFDRQDKGGEGAAPRSFDRGPGGDSGHRKFGKGRKNFFRDKKHKGD